MYFPVYLFINNICPCYRPTCSVRGSVISTRCFMFLILCKFVPTRLSVGFIRSDCILCSCTHCLFRRYIPDLHNLMTFHILVFFSRNLTFECKKKTIIFQEILYGCKTLSLTLRKGRYWRCFVTRCWEECLYLREITSFFNVIKTFEFLKRWEISLPS